MNREDQTTVRYRSDGSIDTAHYMQKGRVARAQQARSLARLLWQRGTVPTTR